MARLNRARAAPVLLALLTLAVTLWLWRWALFNHVWGPDEELYRHFARGVSRDFGLIFNLDPAYGRGIQRLHLLVWAIPMALFKNPQAFAIAHLLFVAIYASATIPAWLIARGCGLGPYRALIPALLAVITPWAVVTTSFLAEPIGYGVFAWAVWAIWRAAVRPSLGADALAVGLLTLAVVARTGFLLMLPVLPAVALLQAWRYGTADGPVRDRLRRLPAAAVRRHPLAIGLGAAAVTAVALAWAGVLPGGPGRVTGSYGTSLPPLDMMLGKWRSFLSRIAAGTGFLMLAAALPWLLARILRPREPALHAFAWTALLAGGAVLLSLVGGPGDERYVMFVAFPVTLAASIAFLRRQLGPGMAIAGGAAVLALFFTPGWGLTDTSDAGYFGYPAESFMGRVLLVKLGQAVSSVDPRATAAVLLAGMVAAVAVLAWRPAWRRWLPLALIPAAAFQLTASTYAIKKHVDTAGARAGAGLKARAWIDEHVPRGEDVGLYAVSNGFTGDYVTTWREVQYWNTTVRSVVRIESPLTTFPGAVAPYPFGTYDVTAALDPATGTVRRTGKWPFPRYMAVPQPPLAAALNWRVVATAPYIPVTLVEVEQPLQARTTLAGVSPEGFMTPGTPAVVTAYRAGRPRPRCVFVDLITPAAVAPKPGDRLRYRVVQGSRVIARGSLASGKLQRVYVPMSFGDRPTADFSVSSFGTLAAHGGERSIQIGNYEAQPAACPRVGKA